MSWSASLPMPCHTLQHHTKDRSSSVLMETMLQDTLDAASPPESPAALSLVANVLRTLFSSGELPGVELLVCTTDNTMAYIRVDMCDLLAYVAGSAVARVF
jgi:hypothetical protein